MPQKKTTKKTPYNFGATIFEPSEIGFIPRPYIDAKDVKYILPFAISQNDFVGNSKGVYYANIPLSFDIETTSFYRDLDGTQYDYNQRQKLPKDAEIEKLGIMYVWQLGINGYCIVGRNWQQFLTVCAEIVAFLGLNENKRLIIYVHNLSFEFQFICRLFDWQTVFSIDLRKPLYALTKSGLEFRCSYLLSGYNLATLAKNLTKYKIKKLVGDLDYHLIRHEKTPLNDTEIGYCLNDIKIVMLYILEYIENVKNIHNIPYTKTGVVRKYCRKQCLTITAENGKKYTNYKYKDEINDLQISDLKEFDTLQRAFCGGFTHANANYIDKVINDVSSYDFTSSYPYVMISEKYPMSKGVKIDVKSDAQFNFLMQKFLCVFDIEFNEIFANGFENPISVSKCFCKENFAENNGRLVAAKRVCTTITNVDFNIIKNFYTWKNYRVGFMYVYRSEYLPTPFVKSIIELYKKKTELKGVDGMETEYLASKEMLNACYGMCVTNPLRDENIFDVDGWHVKQLTDSDRAEMLIKHNVSENRFLYYIWGVFVTAYARRNLFTAIYELKNDYVYSDTDSVKFINKERHLQYFEDYNKLVIHKLQTAAKFHGVNFDDLQPKTIKGKTKLLGVWDFEGTYKRFKTLGAKRYMVEIENALNVDGKNYDFSLTVSGVNKKYAIPYLLEKYGKDGIFDAFTNYLKIPTKATGKNISTYIDYETTGTIIDYLGNVCNFDCKSGLHLEPTEYNLNLSVMFLQYLAKIKQPTE